MLFIIACVGMDWVTRVQMFLLVLLIISQFDFLIGSFMPKDEEKKYGFVGYNLSKKWYFNTKFKIYH